MDPVPWREAWHEALYAAERGFYVTAGGPAAHFTTATHGPSGRVLAEALLRLADLRPAVVVDIGAGRGELATHLLHALLDDLPHGLTPPRPRSPDSAPLAPNAVPFAPNAAFGVEPSGIPVSSAPNAGFGAHGAGGTGAAGNGGEPEPEVAARPGPRVIAVDVVDRPDGLDERIEWVRSPGGPDLPDELDDLEDALVVAHEWLDVVPCTIAEMDAAGILREVLVDPTTGDETPGAPVSEADRAWAERHWPSSPGDRVEIGRSRDEAWAGLLGRVRSGTVVGVDYGHTRTARPSGGTLTAYASGRQVDPVPDGTCDITAHVAMDSLDHDELRTQRDLLRELGYLGRTTAIGRASADPLGYLAALERTGAEAQLIAPHGFGAFWWAVKRVRSGDAMVRPGNGSPRAPT